MKWTPRTTLLVSLALLAVALAVIVRQPTRFGLDIRGGAYLVYKAQRAREGQKLKEATEQAKEVIRNRADQLGVSEPLINVQGEDRIVVQLPFQPPEQLEEGEEEDFMLKELKRAKEVIGRTAFLEFKDENGKVILTGGHLEDAYPATDQLNNPIVSISFNKEGARLFANFTRANVGKPLGIYLDGEEISSPEIREPILGGKGQISGVGGIEEAKNLAVMLRAGALPVPLELVEERTVGPTLGKESVDQSLKACAIAVLLIFLYMILYYRISGFVAVLSLSAYGAFLFALFKNIGVTVTLPGIAGIILSLGMAVDANILIFERLREEFREGKTLHAAIDTAFQRAFAAILDANITTLIPCAILYQYGTGPIKGFAVTLSLGILTSMFTAFVVSKSLLHLIMGWRMLQKPFLFGVSDRAPFLVRRNVPFIALRKVWLMVTALLMVPMFFLVVPPANLARFPPPTGFNKSVDFEGGTLYLVRTEKRPETPELARALKDFGQVPVQRTGDNEYFIRIKPQQAQGEDEEVLKAVEGVAGKTAVLQKDMVGPVIGADLTRKALLAVLFSSVLILFYVALRFRSFFFGVATLIPLLHDVLVVMGVFALLGRLKGVEVDSLFVTAVLTVVGYSVNDTVVVLDRVRENRKRLSNRPFEEVVNLSLLQTAARSLNTTLTTIFPLIALMFAGGPTLLRFVQALLIGFAAGAYSSIFVAAPLLVTWQLYRRRKTAARTAVPSRGTQPPPPKKAAPKPVDPAPSAPDGRSPASAKPPASAPEAATAAPTQRARRRTKKKQRRR